MPQGAWDPQQAVLVNRTTVPGYPQGKESRGRTNSGAGIPRPVTTFAGTDVSRTPRGLSTPDRPAGRMTYARLGRAVAAVHVDHVAIGVGGEPGQIALISEDFDAFPPSTVSPSAARCSAKG